MIISSESITRSWESLCRLGERFHPIRALSVVPCKRRGGIVDHLFGDLTNFHLCFVVDLGRKSGRERRQPRDFV